MSNEKREWKGITINEGSYQGKIIEDPVIVATADGNKCAFMKMKTFINTLGPNGQWTDKVVVIPLVVMDQRKVEVVEKYIQQDREILARAYYDSWEDGNGNPQHGMIVTRMQLGSKGFKKDFNQAPPMPE